jgi:flagellin
LNAQDGISAVQTAEGALTEVHDMLQRMNELAVKASNGTMSTDDRNYIQSEIDQLVSEIDRVATTTKFNETYLLRGENKVATTYESATVGSMTTSATTGIATMTFSKAAGQEITVGSTTYKLVADDATIGGTPELGTTSFKAKDMDSFLSAVNIAAKRADSNVKNISFDGTQLKLEAFAKDPAKSLKFDLQVGADSYASNQINVNINAMSAKGLGVNGLVISRGAGDTTTDETQYAREAIETITAAIQRVSSQRSSLGAAQNRLEHTINNLDNVVENTTAAESAIRDTDMASEMVKYSNNQILAQAGQSMLAQANQSNQGVLSILG